jgi:hypothetical protein
MSTLANLDSIYRATVSQLPTESRLFYCTRQLDKLQLLLINNADNLDRQQKEQLKEMIRATQDEIHALEKLSAGGQ